MISQHRPSNRALAVRGTLVELWGDRPPATPDPWLTATEDGLACDDDAGRRHGFVVLGDGLDLDTVRDLVWSHPEPDTALAQLPAGLLDRV
ncbi:hypothetical protein [Kineococcus sp. SYSU DK003]|uniref:hypothetical protein n=1 Tax=Kineococcus sp. SYSU DK003 TaxID=3383124 RepID=UPI003D7CBB0C